MSAWTNDVEEPFRADGGFWLAITLNLVALAAIVVVAVLNAIVDAPAARASVVIPLLLLLVAAAVSHAATQRTRPSFAGADEWRQAERRAVAAALKGVVRR
jgi:hypothetical protein